MLALPKGRAFSLQHNIKMSNYILKKAEIPEGGIAHTIVGLGKVTIDENLSDVLIERLPEELRNKYFSKKT